MDRQSLVLGCMVLLCLAVPAEGQIHDPERACRSEYRVAPGGSDSASGGSNAPFRTLERARDAVRADPLRGRCAVVVSVRGEHRLDRPLMLDSRDSGTPVHEVTWRADPGESAIISGAVRVSNWSLHDSAKNIWRAYTGPRESRQLYVNGARATRARTAPYPAAFARTDKGFRYVQPGGSMPVWANPTAIEAVTITQWKMMRCPVAAIVGPDIEMRQPCWKNANVFQAKAGDPVLWSFVLLTRFENAYEFLDEPGEWYLDSGAGWLYYIPRSGESMQTANVELPVAEALVEGRGEFLRPIAYVRFEGFTFAHATWLGPSGPNGYAADQSGFHLVGEGHQPNIMGHDPNVVRTPGNVRFEFARHITFARNTFVHLGGVALDFATGSQDNLIVDNHFEDISSAAIQVGGVDRDDHHPVVTNTLSRDNRIANNLVRATGRDYVDAAGIMIGFTTRSVVEHNDIEDVPWAGIAIGWGWGLRDPGTKDEPGSFPGVPGATPGQWGSYATPSASRGNRIVHNRIRRFLMELWDGGAIYSLGQQGESYEDGELIAWNVASDKRPLAGGNIFYTDGGSRYVMLIQNVSYDNPVGVVDFGPCGLPTSLGYCGLNGVPYGSDSGGCIPHGDLTFLGNYWTDFIFFDPCPYKDYPQRVLFVGNTIISSKTEVPQWILDAAGRQPRR